MLTLSKLQKVEPAIFAGNNLGKEPSPKLIASTIRQLVKEFKDTPQSINSGNCDLFAERLVSRLKYGYAMETVSLEEEDCDDPEDFDEDLTDVPNHAFVQIGDRYYDAETPQGVTNWWDLPVYKRYDFKETVRPITGIFTRKLALVGSETFEQWLVESNRSERKASFKRRVKQMRKSIDDNIKCTHDNPCGMRKWEQERGRDSMGITGLEGKQFCLWCHNLYEK